MNESHADCFVCGESTYNTHGIPVYEDIILPNDWEGEWFGQTACLECFKAQNKLTRPVLQRNLR